METFSALLALCAGNTPVTGEFRAHRSETRSFDVFFDLRLNKRLSKQPWDLWFETPSWSLWRHCNESCLENMCIFVGFRLRAGVAAGTLAWGRWCAGTVIHHLTVFFRCPGEIISWSCVGVLLFSFALETPVATPNGPCSFSAEFVCYKTLGYNMIYDVIARGWMEHWLRLNKFVLLKKHVRCITIHAEQCWTLCITNVCKEH